MTVKYYTDEFYKLNIRSIHIDDEVARYLDGLRTSYKMKSIL